MTKYEYLNAGNHELWTDDNLLDKTNVSGLDDIIGQRIAIRVLRGFLKKGTIAHALLFTGMAGIGKRSSARLFAMALNCENHAQGPQDPGKQQCYTDPCLVCRNCRQIQSGSHPDVLFIEPQGALLRINQIRTVLNTLTMKPSRPSNRVIIIADAHAMNAEAGNALLKALEEPAPDTYLILTTRSESELLPTIVSRCQHVRFNPLSPADILELLKARQVGQDQDSETLARLSAGSFSRALDLSCGQWREKRTWLIKALGLFPPPSAHDHDLARALALAGHLSQQADPIVETLSIAQTWIRDLCIWPYAPELVMNSDSKQILSQMRSRTNERHLLFLWDCIESAQKSIAANANIRLTLEVMALRMAEYDSA
jgi:DNA polymerase-3 subunit delta'